MLDTVRYCQAACRTVPPPVSSVTVSEGCVRATAALALIVRVTSHAESDAQSSRPPLEFAVVLHCQPAAARLAAARMAVAR